MEGTQVLEAEIQQLKKSNRRNRVILLVMFVLLLSLSAFAYVQRIEAQQQKTLSESLMERLQQSKAIAENAQLEAMKQRTRAEENELKCNLALQACQQKGK
jgi:hypothetical protein